MRRSLRALSDGPPPERWHFGRWLAILLSGAALIVAYLGYRLIFVYEFAWWSLATKKISTVEVPPTCLIPPDVSAADAYKEAFGAYCARLMSEAASADWSIMSTGESTEFIAITTAFSLMFIVASLLLSAVSARRTALRENTISMLSARLSSEAHLDQLERIALHLADPKKSRPIALDEIAEQGREKVELRLALRNILNFYEKIGVYCTRQEVDYPTIRESVGTNIVQMYSTSYYFLCETLGEPLPKDFRKVSVRKRRRLFKSNAKYGNYLRLVYWLQCDLGKAAPTVPEDALYEGRVRTQSSSDV